MPNITWLEPQIVADLLAMNLYQDQNGMELPGEKEIAVVSPWLSNIELILRPSLWHQHLTVGHRESSLMLGDCLRRFCENYWKVHLAVLQFGKSPSGLSKDVNKFDHERRFLREAMNFGAKVYLCSDLHAKGIVSPLAIITGGTNYTHSGLYLQSQNSNYFAFDHPDYSANRIQLLAKFSGIEPVGDIDELN
jgi:hypothetical protein